MEDVLSETAITYPEVYVQEMTGAQIKAIMEDICDNLFNPDPYYQQGGDMVRIGGMDYACAPAESVGKRISDMTLDNGRKLEADKTYKVAGWASVNPQAGQAGVGRVRRNICAAKRPRSRRNSIGWRSKACRTIRAFPDRGRQCVSCLLGLALAGDAWRPPRCRRPRAQTPLPDKPFAEHHLVLQLSDREPDKQALVHQRRLQSAEGLRPRQDRHRGRCLRPRHRSAARGKSQPRARRQPDLAGRAIRHLHEHGRYARARRQARRHQSESRQGAGRRRAASWN